VFGHQKLTPAGKHILGEPNFISANLEIYQIKKLLLMVQVVGMHFMNPPPLMKLVEVIRGIQTNDATHETVCGLAERYGMHACCLFLRRKFDFLEQIEVTHVTRES
jgi:3-hydroxybutyryl-CoA dehydrogenase